MRVVQASIVATGLVLWALLSAWSADVKPVRLTVAPRLTVQPTDAFHLTVVVEPDDANRTLQVMGISDNYSRASSQSLDGASERRVHEIWWNARAPCGLYTFTARVLDQSGHILNQVNDRANICAVDTDGGADR